MLEQFLIDLQRPRDDDARITSRTIHSTAQITGYVGRLEDKVKTKASKKPLVVDPVPPSAAPASSSQSVRIASSKKIPDIFRTFHRSTDRRLMALHDELSFLRRNNKPNAATMVLRVLLELTIDVYAKTENLDIGGDRNTDLEAEIRAFRKQIGIARIVPTKTVSQALNLAAGRPIGITGKLEKVIDHLVQTGTIVQKEANALKRNLDGRQTLQVLNDALHRLTASPTLDKLNHALEDIVTIYNAMVPGPK